MAVGPVADHAACGSGLVTECQPLGSAAVLITPGTCHSSCEPDDPSCHPFLFVEAQEFWKLVSSKVCPLVSEFLLLRS